MHVLLSLSVLVMASAVAAMAVESKDPNPQVSDNELIDLIKKLQDQVDKHSLSKADVPADKPETLADVLKKISDYTRGLLAKMAKDAELLGPKDKSADQKDDTPLDQPVPEDIQAERRLQEDTVGLHYCLVAYDVLCMFSDLKDRALSESEQKQMKSVLANLESRLGAELLKELA